MRAARWKGRGRIIVEPSARPVPTADEAVVAVDWVGLCGSDVEEYVEGPVVIREGVVLGHEIVGTVAEPAADGSGPPAGTRVVVDVVTGCGHCYWCVRHDEGLCPDLVVTGQHVDGGLADFVLGRADRLIPIPDGLDSRTAALAEPLSVAVRAARKAGRQLGRSVVIVGGGAIGMLTAQVALAGGASPVIVVEPDEERRRLVEAWGAKAVWGTSAESRRAAVAALVPERGVDLVYECSGRRGMSAESVRLVRRGGLVVLLGVLPELEPLDTLDLVLGEKTVVGSAAHMWDDDVAVAVALLASGAIDGAEMISRTVDLDEVAAAFDSLVDPEEDIIKLLVRVGGDAGAAARSSGRGAEQ